jgi:hypothetical protein
MMNQMQMAGPMPGQAQGIQQVLPGMMPKQGAPTPQAMVGPLSQMHMQQLMQLMMNPRPDGPPLYAVISAISEQQKKAQAQAAMQRQGAMAQGQQAAQQPPVAQEVMAQAQQMQPEEPVMAAYGGEMHGYAGGGAVAFNKGGNLQEEQDRQRIISALESAGLGVQKLAAAGYDVFTMPVRALAGVYNTLARGPRAFGIGLPFIPKEFGTESMTPMTDVIRARETQPPAAITSQQMEAVAPGQTAPSYSSGIDEILAAERARKPTLSATRPGAGTGQPQQRPPAAPTAAPAAPMPGLAGLMGPTAPAGLIEQRGAQSDLATALRNAAKTPEEALRARQEADKLRQGIAGLYETEENRRSGALDKLVSDAQARYNADRFSNPEILGRMLRGAMAAGPRARAGQVLAGMGAGAMEGISSLQNAVTSAQKEQALGQERLFDMRMRREQLRIDQANLMEARASKDQDRINAAEVKVAESRQSLAEAERKAATEERKFGLDERQVAVQEAGLKLRENEAKRGPVPSMQDQMAKNAIDDWLKKNPTKTYSDAVEWWRGKGAGEERRAATMERYADNWEKLDVMQKNELAKQGVTNFQQYARMRDQMVAGNTGAAGAQLPPAALAQLKEGVATTFSNGQQWTLRNGQPTQVK